MTIRAAARAAFVLGAAAVSPGVAAARTPPSLPESCTLSVLDEARTLVCVPPRWNGDLVVFAPGSVASASGRASIAGDPLELPDGTSIPGLVTRLRFAFATTSYSDDGLAIVPGVRDVQQLVRRFEAQRPETRHVYLAGAAEGAAVTALAVEQSPELFAGGLAACGPIGDFRRQIDYLGDFRVLFDHFFPALVPGDASHPPEVSREEWETTYVPAIEAALRAHPARLETLLRVAGTPFDPNDPRTKVEAALEVLWYHVFATRDARRKLGGNPFDNSRRLYYGSGNDVRLNVLVERVHADPAALAAIEEGYQTTGSLTVPLVTLHTTADPVVPYWHEPIYTLKAAPSGLLHAKLPVFRYGHCRFRAEEALVALGLLVLKAEGRELVGAERVLRTESARKRYRALAKLNGLRR